MGQYYLIVNLDKRQYLHPHKFGDGLKLMEFGNSACGTLCGLAVLLADGNGRGGGDLRCDDPIVGSWAGDRIVVAGDYADEGKFLDGLDLDPAALAELGGPIEDATLFHVARVAFEDISDATIRAIAAGEGRHHPLAQLDLTRPGWRDRPGDLGERALRPDMMLHLGRPGDAGDPGVAP